jgi:signal transduction histidine kinase
MWITDSSGIVRREALLSDAGTLIPPGTDLDTLFLLQASILARAARQSHRVQLSSAVSVAPGEPGILILQPIVVRDEFRGFIGGIVTVASMLQTVQQRRPHAHGRLLLLAERDTIGALPGTRSDGHALARDSAVVHLPGGGTWRVIAAQPAEYAKVRFLLWSVGLATLGALIVALLHERRQGTRLAERSAELERLSSELLRANRAKSEFLANVSHELRTPLNAIVGFVELLRDGVYGDLSVRQHAPVERIASSANHLRQLVDQILDLAKMAAGRLEVHLELVDLRPFVLDTASEIESLVNERGLNLSIAVSSSLPRLRTDPMHLRQILMNLLGNAVKFTRSGGIAIRGRVVSARDESGPAWRSTSPASGPIHGWVALQVADSGIGIALGDRERIFEEFEQVNAGPRGDSMQRGTGLGLAISRRLARLLGGDLTVESEVGKGSTFTVWLPLDEIAPVAAPRMQEVAATPGGGDLAADTDG